MSLMIASRRLNIAFKLSTKNSMKSLFGSVRKPNIIVCGDIMLDINTDTHVEKIANEAPIPVYNHNKVEYKLGGCGNVLQNLHGIGCDQLFIFSTIGDDDNGKHIQSLVSDMNVNNRIRIVSDTHTTTKHRYFCNSKILFRCDIENNPSELERISAVSFVDQIEECIRDHQIDCIILSDYNKGVLSHKQCQQIISLANKHDIFTCVDPKKDYTKYTGCSLIKPNRSEAYSLFNMSSTTPIEELHARMFKTIGCKYSVITMAEHGISMYDGTDTIVEKPVVRSVIDVTGAGDVVCSILGYYMTTSIPPRDVIRVATEIATLSVGFPGTYIMKSDDILNACMGESAIIMVDDIPAIKRLHSGKTILFTNGCFDLLHSGHLRLLQFCKERADIVVVGLNSDASVKRLKGPTRPVQNENLRAQLLASLRCVDYVIVFDDDTPLNLIKALSPDMLVKGGDYNPDAIVGREFARETIVFDLVKGNSTTSTIRSIVENLR